MHEIEQLLAPRIMSIPWVGRYGGMTYDITKDGKTYPISENISQQECWEEGKFLDLVPDSTYSSIVFFQESKPLINDNYGRATGSLLLFCWVNYPMIGESSSNRTRIIRDVSSVMYSVPDSINASSISINCIAKTKAESVAFFSKYAYKGEGSLYMYPYDVFTFDLEVKCMYNAACTVSQAKTQIDCIDLR